ncbi:MAG: hypothetical protein AB1416_13905, partial [Actinomycetota bacterium]
AAAVALGALFPTAAASVLVALAGDEDFWVGYRAAEALTDLPHQGDAAGWGALADPGGDDAAARRRARTLEWLQRRGGVERRLEADLVAGPAALTESLATLRRAGATAWPSGP